MAGYVALLHHDGGGFIAVAGTAATVDFLYGRPGIRIDVTGEHTNLDDYYARRDDTAALEEVVEKIRVQVRKRRQHNALMREIADDAVVCLAERGMKAAVELDRGMTGVRVESEPFVSWVDQFPFLRELQREGGRGTMPLPVLKEKFVENIQKLSALRAQQGPR